MKARKTYVLIPVMPTPNGPLHLGHIAGPFLKMDMLARHLRRNGNTVALVSATDPYETHVLPRADEQNKPVEQICAENHRAIHRCLQALDIRYDAFIDPLASPYRARLNGITREVLDDLHAQDGCTRATSRSTSAAEPGGCSSAAGSSARVRVAASKWAATIAKGAEWKSRPAT